MILFFLDIPPGSILTRVKPREAASILYGITTFAGSTSFIIPKYSKVPQPLGTQ